MKPYPKEKSAMSAKEYNKYKNGSGRKKRNKYNATRQHYNGRNYDSGLEANYARKLDLLIKDGQIKEWTPQHRFELKINGQVWRYYKIDFRVVRSDNVVEYVEIKGFPTSEWKQKFDVTKIIFDDLTRGEKAILRLNDKIVKQSLK